MEWSKSTREDIQSYVINVLDADAIAKRNGDCGLLSDMQRDVYLAARRWAYSPSTLKRWQIRTLSDMITNTEKLISDMERAAINGLDPVCSFAYIYRLDEVKIVRDALEEYKKIAG